MAFSDEGIFRQAFGQKIDLEIIGLLEHHKVTVVRFYESTQQRATMHPGLGPVVSQAKPEVE